MLALTMEKYTKSQRKSFSLTTYGSILNTKMVNNANTKTHRLQSARFYDITHHKSIMIIRY